MKVLVTGGAGYIGSHTIVELLKAGHEVVNLDNFSNSEPFVLEKIREITGKEHAFYKRDLADTNATYETLLEEIGRNGKIDAVVHFAAFKSVNESVENPLKYYRNNLQSMVNILEIMQKFGIGMLVFSSSCTVYGQPEVLPVTETSPILPAQSPYGRTKQMCENMIIDQLHSHEGQDAMILRYFNPVGAHPSGLIGELPKGIPNNLVPYITQTGAGLRDTLKIFGKDYTTPDGTCIRDFIHVVDLAKAHVAALEKMQASPGQYRPGIFNIGTGTGISVLEAVNAFQRTTGINLPYQFAERRAGDVEQIWADPSKALSELEWKPAFSLDDAMQHAWNWQLQLGKS